MHWIENFFHFHQLYKEWKITQNLHHFILISNFSLALNHVTHEALDSLGDLVHKLGLDDSLQIILEHLGEIILKLRASEIEQNLRPLWWILFKKFN